MKRIIQFFRDLWWKLRDGWRMASYPPGDDDWEPMCVRGCGLKTEIPCPHCKYAGCEVCNGVGWWYVCGMCHPGHIPP